jgi:hypothetical protein
MRRGKRMDSRARCALISLLVVLLSATLAVTGVAASPGEKQNVQQPSCVFDRQTLWSAPGSCRPHARSYPARVQTPVQRSIYDSALTFGIPYRILLKIAQCESGLNPRASNGTRFGLYQFAPDTFRRAAVQLRGNTGIKAASYWNALDASYAAGYLFATGASRSWTCERSVAGPPPPPRR